MNRPNLDEIWEEARRALMLSQTSPETIEHCRRAFFFGMLAFMKTIVPATLEDPEYVSRMHSQLYDFCQEELTKLRFEGGLHYST